MLHSDKLIGTAPKLLIASTKYLAPNLRATEPICLIGLIMPVVVSQCTTATLLIPESAPKAASTSCTSGCLFSGNSRQEVSIFNTDAIFAIRLPYAPFMTTSSLPSMGTVEQTAASRPNVPLPCMRIAVYSSRLHCPISISFSLICFTMVINSKSREPRSRNWACLTV